MSNRNLVPTPIVNKNGVRTTVHKKVTLAPSAAVTLPSPAIATGSAVLSPEGRTEAITMINDKVKESQSLNEWNPKKWSYGDLGTTLRSCSDAVIIAIRDLLLVDPRGFLQREERDDFLFALAQKNEKVSGTTIHEYITYAEHLRGTPMSTKVDLIKGLHSYHQLPAMQDYSDADQETAVSVITLLSVTKSLYSLDLMKNLFASSIQKTSAGNHIPVTSDDGDIVRLTDNNLVTLLIERPEAASEIKAIITGKGIIDGNLIREMLDSETPSIRDGLI